MTSGQNDPLDETLQQWVVNAPLPPRFQDQVWKRISRVEADERRFSWKGLLRMAAKAFEKPKVAYSYAAVLLAVGIIGGTWTAQVKSSRLDERLGRLYVQTIDPYQTAQISR
jgi:hypothetical protein